MALLTMFKFPPGVLAALYGLAHAVQTRCDLDIFVKQSGHPGEYRDAVPWILRSCDDVPVSVADCLPAALHRGQHGNLSGSEYHKQ